MRAELERAVAAALVVALGGCAMTPTYFRANESRLSNYDVCRAWQTSSRSGDYGFASEVGRAASERGFDRSQCDDLVAHQQRKAAAVIGALLLVGAGVAASRSGGGGSYVPSFQPNGIDTSWDWNQFRDQNGMFVWACRGVQTGQFAVHERCFGRLQVDSRWPAPNL
jgi:hypothetical protein